MQLARVHSRTPLGLKAIDILVEVHIGPGLPKTIIVGLPKTAVKESQHRTHAAILQNGLKFPARKITINLTPADLPKEGGRFDLPIAIGILVASQQLPDQVLKQSEFMAELGLDGSLLPVKGVIPAILAAEAAGRQIIISAANAREAQLTKASNVLIASTLSEVCQWALGKTELATPAPLEYEQHRQHTIDMADVQGQHHAVRAMEICAAGRHHCLMLGAPGSGKTMLARRLTTILPSLPEQEALTVAAILSISAPATDDYSEKDFYQRPFRAPHHTASAIALVGGGTPPRPGEISKAHNGILFLDEFPEFQARALDALREPLETGQINIARAAHSVSYPSNFQLIAAMNPCPNGADVDEHGRCPCDDRQLARYYAKLSAPVLDRFDMHIRVPRIKWTQDTSLLRPCDSSAVIRERVLAAWRIQMERQNKPNCQLANQELKTFCSLANPDQQLLYAAIDRLNLSGRAMHRILRVSRTIADLAASEHIEKKHLLEAIGYRSLSELAKY